MRSFGMIEIRIQWSMITRITVDQMNWWIHSGQGFIGSFGPLEQHITSFVVEIGIGIAQTDAILILILFYFLFLHFWIIQSQAAFVNCLYAARFTILHIQKHKESFQGSESKQRTRGSLQTLYWHSEVTHPSQDPGRS